MDLNEINCFVRVAQQRSITKAAALLGVPKSTVSRKVSALERRLAVTLLNRTTRSISLTEAGDYYFARMSKALTEMEQAEEEIQETQDRVAGVVKLTAPVEFGVGSFMDVLRRFQERYPDVSVELLLTERLVDLVAEGIDVAVRIGELRDSTMISRKLGMVVAYLVASPEYLAVKGIPRNPDDLAKHQLLDFAPNGLRLAWSLRSGASRRTLKVSSRFSTNNILALKSAALGHQGIAALPTFLVQEELDDKRLRTVLPTWQAFGSPINIVFPGQRFVAPKTRALIDFLTAELHFR